MINITLRQLRYFDALAKHRHFGQAAHACSVSQPAMSLQIKELEDQLGCILFERLPRHVLITSRGKDFLKRSQEILRNVEELSELSRAAKGRKFGQLRIGIIPTIAPYILPKIVRDIGDAFEDLDLNIRETMTPTLLKELLAGQIDVAILALPVAEPSLFEVALFDEDFLLVRPEKDKDAPVPNTEMLQEMKLLLLEEGHCFRDQALSFCNIKSSESRKTLEGTSLSTLVQMVGAGIGVTLIPQMAASVETRAAPVSLARFPAPQPKRTIGMVWRKSSPLAQQYQDIAKIIARCR